MILQLVAQDELEIGVLIESLYSLGIGKLFSVKGQIANIVDFLPNMGSVTII